MKCPKCGTDMDTQQTCWKCRLNHDGDRDEIEVEYKDFKTSEFLEIRKKKLPTGSGKETIAEGRIKPQGINPALQAIRGRRFSVVAAVVLGITLIVLAFVVFRFLAFK